MDYCPACRSYRYYTDPTLWLCAWLDGENAAEVRNCNAQAAISRASEWTISGEPIEYCLSERAEGQCQLQANLTVMIVVIFCTLVKIAAVIGAFWTLPHQIMATIGDAVASFLRDRESQTSQRCLLGRSDVEYRICTPGTAFPKVWSARSLTQVWGSAPSAGQWSATILFLGALLITTISFFGVGLQRLKSSPVEASNTFAVTVPPTQPPSFE